MEVQRQLEVHHGEPRQCRPPRSHGHLALDVSCHIGSDDRQERVAAGSGLVFDPDQADPQVEDEETEKGHFEGSSLPEPKGGHVSCRRGHPDLPRPEWSARRVLDPSGHDASGHRQLETSTGFLGGDRRPEHEEPHQDGTEGRCAKHIRNQAPSASPALHHPGSPREPSGNPSSPSSRGTPKVFRTMLTSRY